MHEFQALEDLVDNVLFMNILKYVSPYNSMQICVHEVKYQIDVSIVFCSYHILKPNNVFMPVKFLEKDNLPKSSLRVRRILKGIKVFLKSYNLLGLLIDGLPHNTICSFA